MWKAGVVFVYLLLLSIWDIRECRVPIVLLAVGSVFVGIVVVYEVLTGEISWLQPLLGAFVGILMLLVAWFSKKSGCADGIVLLWVGSLYGYRQGMLILGVSLFLISLASVVLLMLRRVKRNSAIPYITFLTAGFAIVNYLC